MTVVGRREPVSIYEPMLPETYESRGEALEIFAQGLRRFYHGEFEQAIDRFASIQEDDPPAKAYLGRCRDLLEKPPDNWQGIWVISAK